MRQRPNDYCDIDQMITGIGLTADVFHCYIYTVFYEHFRENGHKIIDILLMGQELDFLDLYHLFISIIQPYFEVIHKPL